MLSSEDFIFVLPFSAEPMSSALPDTFLHGGDFGAGATRLGSGTLHGGPDLHDGIDLHGVGDLHGPNSAIWGDADNGEVLDESLDEEGESGDVAVSASAAPNLGSVWDCVRNKAGGEPVGVNGLVGIAGGSPRPADRVRCELPGELPTACRLLSGDGVECAERVERVERMERAERADTIEQAERVVTNDRAEQREMLSSPLSPLGPFSGVGAGFDANVSKERAKGLMSAAVSSCDGGGSNAFGHSCNKHLCSTACRRASSRSHR